MPAPLRDVPLEGIELIKSFEGIPDGDPSTVNIDPYLDPVGIWTIGWGHAITQRGEFLRGAACRAAARALFPGGITRAQAEALLCGDLVDTAAGVCAAVKVPLGDAQFGAIVSFAFNAGLGNLSRSTLLRCLNAGDFAGAAQQLLAWDKGRVNGVLQPLRGLTRRRLAERALFLGQDWRAVAGATRNATQGSGKPEAPEADRQEDTAPTAAVMPRARTTRSTAQPPAPRAARPAPRTVR